MSFARTLRLLVLPLASVAGFMACTEGGHRSPSPATVASPAITSQPAAQSVNAGQSATFSVTASGTGASYQWQFNGTAIPGATSSSYTIANVTAANAGSYTVVISNAAGSVTSTPVVLSVNLPPTIRAFTVSPNTIGIGGGAILSWDVTGATSLSVDQGGGKPDE